MRYFGKWLESRILENANGKCESNKTNFKVYQTKQISTKQGQRWGRGGG